MSVFDTMLQLNSNPHMVAAIAAAAGEVPTPKCRWWARRHRWETGAVRGRVTSGHVTYRQVACRRCGWFAEVSAGGKGRFFRGEQR